MLAVCDPKRRIRYFVLGWPSSVHDNRVWETCHMRNHPEQYFSPGEYLFGDSAFSPSDIMVSSFKKMAGVATVSRNEETFNNLLSRARVISEHTFGMLKCRFPWLRHIRQKLESDEDLEQVMKYIKCAIILHNVLINSNCETNEYFVDSRYQEHKPAEEELNALCPLDGSKGRRQQLMSYLAEYLDVGIH